MSPVPHDVTVAKANGQVVGATAIFTGGSKSLSLKLSPGHLHVLLLSAGPSRGWYERDARRQVRFCAGGQRPDFMSLRLPRW